MNYRGSYRHLTKNAKSALLCAVEIYNKPRIEYREECFVILLLNAWELLLKAILSKKKVSIYYKKKRNEPYKTLSWKDALLKTEKFFPKDIGALAVRRNLDMLSTYRDNAVHFYNQSDFFAIIYALAQTSIINFKELLERIFGQDLAEDISWQLLPLGINPPVDPITYISSTAPKKGKRKKTAVGQFLTLLSEATAEIGKAKGDTGRLLTIFNLKLESTKKIKNADFVVGVGSADTTDGPLTVVKTADPNVTHPLRQMEVLDKVEHVSGVKITSFVLQAVVWHHSIKSKKNYCWQASEGVLTRYSHEFVTWLKTLTRKQIEAAISAYKEEMRRKRKKMYGKSPSRESVVIFEK